ncbi:CBO0543 family protein [Neobacillus niacini]|uniref:CBO0543 family protein n=1 Tax=Neobacillus niacini TaxID=86668 RepID=UPI0021CB4485|nr:CBO0543 family protein [Neobacillus niacini]MCM3768777.1 hypothetical protein [Neobacillus niacini]
MNTVKHLNSSKLPPLQNKRLTFWNKRYLVVAVVAVILGTLLDHFFVTRGMYEFPVRALPEVFSINIGFTCIVLPIFVVLILHLILQVEKWGRIGIILFVSLLMPIGEKLAEELGLFRHSEQWQHIYTFFGYLLFWTVIYRFYRSLEKMVQ